MSQFYQDSIFWIDTDKVKPNPYQPRREFDEMQLKSLADSIRQYGVLQALVVTRKEYEKPDGGLAVEYELIAGERRLRASKLAGILQVPVIIKTGEDNDLMKLELAIIENVQREDLNPVDRAKAFDRLAKEFGFKHAQIAEKVGKSREYVTNSLRLLHLPEEILSALSLGKISEGHARPLGMLAGRAEEQNVLFKEIMFKKLTVREAEAIARKIAVDKVRKKEYLPDPELREMEEKLEESLGTRVHIERRESGGKLSIDFFSNDDLRTLIDLFKSNKGKTADFLNQHISNQTPVSDLPPTASIESDIASAQIVPETVTAAAATPLTEEFVDDRTPVEKKEEENEEIYSIKNFSL